MRSVLSEISEEHITEAANVKRCRRRYYWLGGTAFTVLEAPNGATAMPELEEIDFYLDRPFLFAVTSADNLPLFAGVVNQP